MGSTPSVSMVRSRGSGGEAGGVGKEVDGGGFVRVGGCGGSWSDVGVVSGVVGEMRCQRPQRPCLIAAAATGGTGLVDAVLGVGFVVWVSDVWRRCLSCDDALAANTFSLLIYGTTSMGSVVVRREMTVPSR